MFSGNCACSFSPEISAELQMLHNLRALQVLHFSAFCWRIVLRSKLSVPFPAGRRQVMEKDKPDTPAAENPYAQFHVVVKGDTLSKIAKQYYGDPSLYPQIFEANRDILKDPNKIQVGQRLRIP